MLDPFSIFIIIASVVVLGFLWFVYRPKKENKPKESKVSNNFTAHDAICAAQTLTPLKKELDIVYGWVESEIKDASAHGWGGIRLKYYLDLKTDADVSHQGIWAHIEQTLRSKGFQVTYDMNNEDEKNSAVLIRW